MKLILISKKFGWSVLKVNLFQITTLEMDISLKAKGYAFPAHPYKRSLFKIFMEVVWVGT